MTVLFAVGAGVTRADIPGLCGALADRLRGRDGPGGRVLCDVSEARADMITVEALARLRLTAGRHGWRFDTRGATAELLTLFSLMGLGGVFFSTRYARGYPQPAAGRRGASGGQAVGQAEQREQALGVEEVVDPGDAAV